jgi:hypothetical protein
MTEWTDILSQLGRDRYQTTGNKWVNPQSESVDTESITISDKPDTSQKIHFPKIKKQMRKKTPSTQSIRDRVSEKSVLLSDKLGCRGHK